MKAHLCFAAALTLALPQAAAAVEWNVSLWGKPRAFTAHVEKLAELVEARSGGGFTIVPNYGGLSKNRENLENLAAGAFEMAQFCVGYHPEKTPTLTVMELPFLGVDSLERERRISEELYQHPAVRADLARWNATLLMPSPLPQYNLAGVGSPPRSMYALRQTSVRATGGIAEAMKVLDMEPVALPATEVQDALTDRKVDAVAFAPHAHMAFGVAERADWWTTNLNPGTVHCPIVANNDALDALPDEYRAVLLTSLDDALDHYIENYDQSAMAAWEQKIVEFGIEKITLSDTALEILEEAAHRDAFGPWIAEKSNQGLPAQALLELVTATE